MIYYVLQVEILNQGTDWTNPSLWLPLVAALVALVGVGWQVARADKRAREDRRHAIDQAIADRRDNREREFLAWRRENLLSLAATAIHGASEASERAVHVQLLSVTPRREELSMRVGEQMTASQQMGEALSALRLIAPPDLVASAGKLQHAGREVDRVTVSVLSTSANGQRELDRIGDAREVLVSETTVFMSTVQRVLDLASELPNSE